MLTVLITAFNLVCQEGRKKEREQRKEITEVTFSNPVCSIHSTNCWPVGQLWSNLTCVGPKDVVFWHNVVKMGIWLKEEEWYHPGGVAT